jgi:penicillin amidase
MGHRHFFFGASMAIALGTAFSFGACAPGMEVERLESPGVAEPVEILIDRWGVPHIYARNEHDLFFAQGFQAARDRLFQFEVWRRQATGTVAEILGRRELKRDIGARLLRFRGDMTAELNHYHLRGEAIVNAYVEGVNAWIERTRSDPSLLPIEFHLLAIQPEPWTPDVVVSRHQGLVFNLTQELALGRSVSLLGAERVKSVIDFHPGEPDLALDPKVESELLFADILEFYREARSPLRFRPEDLATAAAPKNALLDIPRWSIVQDEVKPFDLRDIGSNNWVLSGSRTRSGKPLMANDPHRTLQAPSLRYFAHLSGPGWNVIGGGEPVLPGISIGHNEHGAWGLTIFHIDAEDLYVYETDTDDPLRYRYGDGWETMRTIRETIPIKGESPVTVELRYTRHGPVLSENREHHRAYALRAGWLEVGGAPYLASLRMDVARTWEEFRDACTYNHLPGENMVWADREGNIGWQPAGIAPLRPNWNGLVPIPGDGRYEWGSPLPIRDLPHVHNPERGFWNTSNEALIPPDYPHRSAVGWTWADPYRGDRVREVLSASNQHTVEESTLLQQDELSIPARQLLPLLIQAAAHEPRYKPTISLLADWDFRLDEDSPAAGLYVMWERRVEQNLRDRLVPAQARRYLPELSMRKIIGWLQSPDEQFGPDSPSAARDALLRTSLDEAIAELTKRFGPDTANWRYGQTGYKHALIQHPMSAAVDDQTRQKLDVGPRPRGGNSHTVNNTGRTDRQPSGGSFRVVIDTADWDSALATNTPGQSGDPQSPHYRDLFEPWDEGHYFPLLYTRDKIEPATQRRFVLEPQDQ